MKLIAPGVGWATRAGRLYFSDNSGLDWKDITPAIASGGRFGGIFFLNPSKAWVTVNHVSNSGIARTFDVVSTDDGGSSWSSTAISLRQEDYGIHVWDLRDSRASSITFVDNLNGWMNIVFEAQTSNTWATALLLTSDGGRTWKKAPDAPTVRDPQMLMMSPSWGYLYGGDFPAGFSLYVTRDAFHTWEQVNLEVPGSTESSAAGLPKFEDSKTGYLEVHGIHREANRLLLSLALMRTSDGGRTWKIDRMVSNLSAAQAVQYRNPAIADSEWIFTAGSSKGPMLTKLSEGARVEAAGVANASPKYKDLRGVSWASPMQGWAVMSDGSLMSTTDGGATWTDISPGPKPHVIHPLNGPSSRASRSTTPASSSRSGSIPQNRAHLNSTGSPGSNAFPSKHLGFDAKGWGCMRKPNSHNPRASS
jgi:photosystem II stability/assembly factor-like uncharacterized protein